MVCAICFVTLVQLHHLAKFFFGKINRWMKSVTVDQKEFVESVAQFEAKCASIDHKSCTVCQRVSLSTEMDIKKNVCKLCSSENAHLKKNPHSLPVWVEKKTGKVHHEVPQELTGLRIGEQMLIQRVSLLVPIEFMKIWTDRKSVV